MTEPAVPAPLPHGPLPEATAHVCVDMQRLFAEKTSWASGAVAAALPGTLQLADGFPGRTVFTRFIPATSAAAAERAWQTYYRAWPDVTLDHLAPDLLDLVPDLARRIGGAPVIDKTTFGAFESPAFGGLPLIDRAEALVFSGVETDMCVLATLMAAVDRGYRCVLAVDAVASSDAAGHRAVVEVLAPRLPEMIETATVDAILAARVPAAAP